MARDGFLSKSYERHFNERPYLNHPPATFFLTEDDKGAQPRKERFQHAVPRPASCPRKSPTRRRRRVSSKPWSSSSA